MSNRVLLVTPPYHCGVVEVAGRWMPLGLVYIAGSLKKAGFSVEIYDAMSKFHSHSEIGERIKKSKPNFIGVTACTPTFNDALKVLETAKTIDRSVTTILGGVHPTFCNEEILRRNAGAVDYIVRGEGEHTIVELLRSLTNGKGVENVKGIAFHADGDVVKTPERNFTDDLESLTPAWELVEWKDYTYFVIPRSRLGMVSSSRGCSHDCAFCSQFKFWKQTWRGREPRKFVEEVDFLHKNFKVNVFLICDEFPTRDRSRWEEILDRLIKKKMDAYFLMETCVEDITRD
ncbi:MAG: cobalamin-dependent protein, partial [bacterium]